MRKEKEVEDVVDEEEWRGCLVMEATLLTDR